jgi:diguanylate cyclase (GGDEF)-like protein
MDSDEIGQSSLYKVSYFINNNFLSEESLRFLFFNILENLESAIIVYDNNLNCIFYNSKFLKVWNLELNVNDLFGFSFEKANSFLSKKVLNSTAFLNKNSEILDSSKETLDIVELKNGTILEMRSTPLLDGIDLKGKMICYKDITKKIKESLSENLDKEILTTVIQDLPFYLLIVDRDFNLIFANKQARNHDSKSSSCYRLLFGRESSCEDCQIENVIHKNNTFVSEMDFKNKKTFSVIMSSLRTSLNNDLISIFAIDISKHKETANRNLYLSYIDPLTEILNRRGFFVHIKGNYEKLKLDDKKLFLFFFDIDGLKKINDNYGHINGDLAINNIAKILKSAFRENDLLARFGGDEFVALVKCNSKTNSDQILERISKKIYDFNSSEVLKFNLSVSCGVSEVRPDQLQDIEKIIHQADQAMYSIKKIKS